MTDGVIVVEVDPRDWPRTSAIPGRNPGDVIEATDRVGGKMLTSHRDGFVIDEGAFFLPIAYRTLLSSAADVGIADGGAGRVSSASCATGPFMASIVITLCPR